MLPLEGSESSQIFHSREEKKPKVMAVKENSLFLPVSPETRQGSETEQPQDPSVSQRLLQLHSTNSFHFGFARVLSCSFFYYKHFTP